MLRDGAVVRSAIPGRERWEIAPLRSRPRYAAAIERELSRHSPIRQVWANPVTGRLLVKYDPGVRRDEVRDRLRAALGVAQTSVAELQEWRSSWPRGFHRLGDDLAVQQARSRLILSGSLLAGVLAKRAIFGVGMFAGSPAFVTASAILTIASSYTALRRGFDGWSGKVGIPGGTLLTIATLGLHVAAESLDGLGALAAAHAGELLHARATRDSRNAIRTIEAWWERDEPVARIETPQPITTFDIAALLAAGGAYVLTHDPQRSIAMLVGGIPLATRESTITARALALRQAVRRGIFFRDPDTITSLRRPPAVVRDFDALENARAAGYAPIAIAADEETDASLMAEADIGIAIVSRSSRNAIDAAGVLLLDAEPETVDAAVSLIARASRVVAQDGTVSRLVGAGGFTAAAFGKLPLANAAKLHNYTRLALELNSLRLAWP